MTINDIAAANSTWDRRTVAEVWLRRFTKEAGTDDFAASIRAESDDNGEYTLTSDQVDLVWSEAA